MKKKLSKPVRFSNGKAQAYGRDVPSSELCQWDNQPSHTWPAIPENWQARSSAVAAAAIAPNPMEMPEKGRKQYANRNPGILEFFKLPETIGDGC